VEQPEIAGSLFLEAAVSWLSACQLCGFQTASLTRQAHPTEMFYNCFLLQWWMDREVVTSPKCFCCCYREVVTPPNCCCCYREVVTPPTVVVAATGRLWLPKLLLLLLQGGCDFPKLLLLLLCCCCGWKTCLHCDFSWVGRLCSRKGGTTYTNGPRNWPSTIRHVVSNKVCEASVAPRITLPVEDGRYVSSGLSS